MQFQLTWEAIFFHPNQYVIDPTIKRLSLNMRANSPSQHFGTLSLFLFIFLPSHLFDLYVPLCLLSICLIICVFLWSKLKHHEHLSGCHVNENCFTTSQLYHKFLLIFLRVTQFLFLFNGVDAWSTPHTLLKILPAWFYGAFFFITIFLEG